MDKKTTEPAGVTLTQIADEQAPDVPGYPYEWGGRTWRLKPQFDIRCVAALQAGQVGRALGLMLGKDQADEFLTWDTPDEEAFTDTELGHMIEICGQAGGLTSPESSASQTS